MSKKYVSVLKDSAATPGYRIIAPEDYVYTENGTKKVKKIDSKADKKVPATAGNLATLDSTGNLADSGKQTTDFMNALTTAYEASGSATKTVTKVTQAKTGAVTVTYSDIQSGTTSQKGLVQLEDSTSSTSTTKAATPNSVKSAYDLANGKYSKPIGGIPASDMDSAVQASLGKADTAIQGVKLNGSTLTPSSAKVVDLGNLKTKQTAVSDPSASGTTITAIATIAQDANGVITATKKTIQSASQSQAGVMSAADKKKLDDIATGAEVNQNAFSNVKVGDVTVAADAKTDTLTLAAGSNVTITPDASSDKITIAAKDTTYTADAGIRLDGTVFKHTNSVSGGTVGPTTDTAGATLSVPYVTYDSQGHVTASGTRTHNVGTATTSGAGIVQLQDSIDATTTKAATPNAVKKAIEALDVASVGGSGKYISAISESDGKISATSTTMDTTPTASSENAVTSGGIKTALDTKADKANITGATKTKITYNSQGIVTAGADLANTDMPKFIYNRGYASTRMNGAPAYDSSTPYKLIGKCTYNTTSNRVAWERFLLMYANTLFEFKLHGLWGSGSTGPSLTIRPISLYGTSLDTIKTRFYPRYSFTQNSATGLVIEFYVMFTGDWQNYRLYQLPAQSGDVGSAEFNAFTMSTNATAIATLSNTAIDFYNGDDTVTVFGHVSSADKATNDSDGNAINSTYLKLSGGTMTGKITALGSQYSDSYSSGALDMNNSNIVGLNSIYTADASDNAKEGIHFYRDATHTDTLWLSGGHMYFVPNRVIVGDSSSTTAADSKKVAILPASITSGHVVVTDGTSGDVKGVDASTLTVGVASKLGTANKGSSTKPIYLAAGVPTECSTYAGGTAVTLNNASKAGSTASFYAPTAGGTANYVLIGNGTTSAPTWAEKAPKAVVTDYPAGFTSRLTSWAWGTLITGNGYTQMSSWKTTNGSQMAFAEQLVSGASDWSVSVQIDGKFYQNEGKYRVLDTSNVSVPSTVPTLAWNTESTLATIDGKNIKVKLPASPDTDTKVTQTLTNSSDAEYPILTKNTTETSNVTDTSRFAIGVTLNPKNKSITATTFIGALSGNASSATILNATATNEINFGKLTTTTVWFNYRKQGDDASSRNITDYYFGNRAGDVTGVTLHAAAFAGTSYYSSNTKVTTANTTKTYLAGATATSYTSGAQTSLLADTGVYLTTTAGELNATQYKVAEHCTMSYNSTKSSLDFTFS